MEEKGKLRALDPLLHPQDEDMLHKESSFVEHFYRLITSSIEPPFAISIDGLWGTGKTTVMQMLQSKLKERNGGYPIFWFNPWEYQEAESIVLAFLQRFSDEMSGLIDKTVRESLKLLGTVGLLGLDVALNSIPEKILSLSLKKVKATGEMVEQELQKEYEKYKDVIKVIQDDFRNLINAVSKKNDGKPVIIFFDDLDRCLPDKTIKLLEAVKNLFIVRNTEVIFICGIDTRIAKQFIKSHYRGIEETFSINYFRKIFNLTISMPYYGSREIYTLLLDYIKELYGWDEQTASALAEMVSTRGLHAEMTSVRKYLNVIHNFYTFQQFNPDYQFTPQYDQTKKSKPLVYTENDVVVFLLIVKEAWQPLYEDLIKEAMKNRRAVMSELVQTLIKEHKAKEKLLSEQEFFLQDYFVSTIYPFHNLKLGHDLLLKYPTLA